MPSAKISFPSGKHILITHVECIINAGPTEKGVGVELLLCDGLRQFLKGATCVEIVDDRFITRVQGPVPAETRRRRRLQYQRE